jgi:hypothetical protein
MRQFLRYLPLSLLLILSTIGSAWSSGANNNPVSSANNTAVSSANNTAVSSANNTAVSSANNTAVHVDDSRLEKLLADYENWAINVATEQLPSEGNNCLMKTGSVIFLWTPFGEGTVTQTCDIKSGIPIIFPFYSGWCDNGNTGLYGVQDYKKISDCALDADKGIVTMQAWLDGKEIVNIKVNNKDVYNLKLLNDKYAGNEYYKVIKTPSFFDLTVTNKSQFASEEYEKPEDFQSSPYTYKAVAHCFCGIVTKLSPGNHELRYKTIIEGTAGLAGDKGWDQEYDMTYKLNVK